MYMCNFTCAQMYVGGVYIYIHTHMCICVILRGLRCMWGCIYTYTHMYMCNFTWAQMYVGGVYIHTHIHICVILPGLPWYLNW